MAAKRVKREMVDLTTHDGPSTPADHGAEYERLQKEVVHKNEVISVLEEFLGKIQKGFCCGICTELLYQPFNLPCGHVFCYSCLVDWFKQTKQCPTCRNRVIEKPAVSYLIKDMVNSLVRRAELVDPEGQGARFNKEQAEADKCVRDHGGDLFPGLFHRTRLPRGNRVVDEADGVLRCIRCHWEVEGQTCTHCGLAFSDDEQEAFSAFEEDVEDLDEGESESDNDDDDEDDDDDDEEDEDEDEYEDSFVVPDDEVHMGDDWGVRARGLYPFYHDIDFSDGDEDMDDEEDEDEEESSEEGDDDDDDDEFEEAHETLPHHPPNVINIDEDHENNLGFLYYSNYHNPPDTSDHDEGESSPEDESDDDELPPRRPGHAPPQNRHPVVVPPPRRMTRLNPRYLQDRGLGPSANGGTNVARQSRRPRANVIDSESE